MAIVRTAHVFGGLAIVLAQASMTAAQNWYNPDIASAQRESQSSVSGMAYQPAPATAIAARTSRWEPLDAPTQPSAAAETSRPATGLFGRATGFTPLLADRSASSEAPRDSAPGGTSAPLTAPGSSEQSEPPQGTSVWQSSELVPSHGHLPPPGHVPPPGTIPHGQWVDPVVGWGNSAASLPAPPPIKQLNHGLFFRWDRLYFTMTDPDVAPIGDPAQEGVYLSNGVPYPFINSLDTGFIGGAEFGDRIEFGFVDPDHRNGWVASVMMVDRRESMSAIGGAMLFDDPTGVLLGFQDGDDNQIDDDLNNNGIFGRFGQDTDNDGVPDAPAPQDNGDLVSWVPVFGELEATSYTDVSGLELSYVQGLANWSPSNCGLNWLFGVRYLDIDDRFRLLGRGGIYDETNISTRTENLVIGPQVGLVLARSVGPWSLAGELRYMPGVNIIEGRQRATFASNAAETVEANNFNRPVNLNATAVAHNFEDETFSNVVEWRIDSSYSLTQWLAIRAGYTGMFLSEIVRGAGNTVYTLPELGIASVDGEDMTLHALTLGLEFYR